ncbi:PD-(D/E)XK nuclease family protein [candidate division WOR-3 bacterium]|nr:PD-(D/E)XK nuclease family protein [candidate division WOR-3 bacterium]
MSKVEIIDFGKSLIDRTAEIAIENDLKNIFILYPSKRFEVFLKEEFKKRLKTVRFLPRMDTIDEFVMRLYQMNQPGFKIASEIETSFVLWKTLKEISPDGMYLGKKEISNFVSFYPWALKLKKSVEQILVESENLPDQNAVYEKFVEMGEYFREYRDFIANLPLVVNAYVQAHNEMKLFTRGVAYRGLTGEKCLDVLKAWDLKSFVFSGFNALNFAEKLLVENILKNFENSIFLVRYQKPDKTESLSPFRTISETVRSLKGGFRADVGKSEVFRYSDIVDKTEVYSSSNVEHEMILMHDVLLDYLQTNKSSRRIGVLLPEPSSLIPFVENVLTRVDPENADMKFNITLDYPFQRTPLFQLLDSILLISQSVENGFIPTSLYLEMIRHPYIKLAQKSENTDSQRIQIHRFESHVIDLNVLELELGEDGDFLNIKNFSQNYEYLRGINRRFLPGKNESVSDLCRRLLDCLLFINQSRNSYLFFRDFLNSAQIILDEVLEFIEKQPDLAHFKDPHKNADFIRYQLLNIPVQFTGTPLEGIQVMGALEFRNLDFDAVFIADCVEGIMPDSSKYDPVLPGDIKEIFKLRSYGEWESIYASNLFSILLSSKTVKIFYPEKMREQRTKRSRFIEKICFSDKRRAKPIVKKMNFSISKTEKILEVEKTKEIKEKILQRGFSPSAFEDYISCPIKFYFKRILNLEERQTLEEEPDAAGIGTIVHESLREFYQERKNVKTPEDITEILKKNFMEQNIEVESGLGKIKFWGVDRNLKKFLSWDMENQNREEIEILQLEKEIKADFEFEEQTVSFKGKVDRVEKVKDELFICDYKTKEKIVKLFLKNYLEFDVPRLKEITDPCQYRKHFRNLSNMCKCHQVMIYIEMWSKNESEQKGELNGKYYFLKEKDKDVQKIVLEKSKIEYREKYLEIFKSFMDDLLFGDKFITVPHKDVCMYCPFENLCQVEISQN